LLESWTGKLVGKMHVHEITYDEVAAELGVMIFRIVVARVIAKRKDG